MQPRTHPIDQVAAAARGGERDDVGSDASAVPPAPPPPAPPPMPTPPPPPLPPKKKPDDNNEEDHDDLRWSSFGGGGGARRLTAGGFFVARRPAARRGGGFGSSSSASSLSPSPLPPSSPPPPSSPRSVLLRPLLGLPRPLRLLALLALPALALLWSRGGWLDAFGGPVPSANGALADVRSSSSSSSSDNPLRRSDRAYRRAALEAVRLQTPEMERREEELLRLVTEECARGEDTAIWIDPSSSADGPVVVLSQPFPGATAASRAHDPAPPSSSSSPAAVLRRLHPAPPAAAAGAPPPFCPPLDVMLRGQERGVGMCADVALYVLRAGARIVAMQATRAGREAYDAQCGRRTARLFLESMYSEFFYGYEREKEEKEQEEKKKQEDEGGAPPSASAEGSGNGEESKNKPLPPASPPSAPSGILHMQLLNSEHMWTHDAHLHARVDAFLCKTRFCERLVRRHVKRRGLKAAVWFIGHTSSDPTVGITTLVPTEGDSDNTTATTWQASSRAAAAAERRRRQELERASHAELRHLGAVHVKGKSGLKHTNQLLECWGKRPDFPRLVVIGRLSLKEARVGGALRSKNVVFFPTVRGSEKYVAAKRADDYGEVARLAAEGGLGPEARRMLLEEEEQQQPQRGLLAAAKALKKSAAASPPLPSFATFAQIRALQSRLPLHLCVSEREGFGHYLNEARAAGALVITTDHPPMSELVTRSSGVLVRPEKIVSYGEMALGAYARINALASSQAICSAVEKALGMSAREVARRRKAVRDAFEAERAEFRLRVGDLASFLRARSAAEEA
jgi:hypothetical protein